MPTTKSKTKPTGRQKVPLYVMLTPTERARLVAFAATIDRPLSWVVRDALTVYMDAAEADAGHLQTLRASVAAPAVDMTRAGQTEQGPGRGRPPKRR